MTRWLFLLFLGVGGAGALRFFALEGIFIASASMEPTLPVGRHIFVNKLVYAVQTPKRGEIVVFPSPVEPDKDLVKRVIGLPGDDIKIERKKVLVNGRPLVEPYAQFTRAGEMLVGDNLDVGKVPPDHVFVLGDNRDQSNDSRDWIDAKTQKHIYFVPYEKLKGRLIGL